jgi:uncharacterized protein YeaO (DUF488 family)
MPRRARRPQVKRVYEPADDSDGMRVLVDRMWPRGLTKDRARVGVWLKEVAPSAALRSWFGHEAERWPEFRARYFKELDANGEAVGRLAGLLSAGKATLVFGAHDVEHNNAVALAEYLAAR